MTDRHKVKPLSIRLPEAERLWLYAYAEQHDIPVRAVIFEAIVEKMEREPVRTVAAPEVD